MATSQSIPAPASSPRLAVAYARCSSAQQGRSVDQQLDAIRRHVQEKGWCLGDTFADEAISGSELNRPGLNALFAYLEGARGTGTVLIWDRSRLGRADPIDVERLESRIRAAGWDLTFLQGYNLTGNFLSDAVVPRLEQALNSEYLRELSVKTQRGLVDHVRGGGVSVGKVPYGFRKRLVYADGTVRVIGRRTKHRKEKGLGTAALVEGDPAEVLIVRRIFSEYSAASKGMGQICEGLNAESVPSPQGGRWCVGTTRAILLNRTYVGDLVWNRYTSSKFSRVVDGKATKQLPAHPSQAPGKLRSTTTYAANPKDTWIVVPDHHPALVPRDLFDQVAKIMHERGGLAPRRRSVRRCYPLTGVLFCLHCGRSYNGQKSSAKGRSYQRYACSSWRNDKSCRPLSVSADRLEAGVLSKLREAYVPDRSSRAKLRGLIVEVLSGRPSEEEDVEVVRLLEIERQLKGKIDRTLLRLVMVDQASAEKLAVLLAEWQTELASLGDRITAARARWKASRDHERAADEILALIDHLESVGLDAAPGERKALYAATIDRIDLEFAEEPPAPGRKRPKRWLKTGRIKTNALLARASKALCLLKAPRA